MRQGNCLYLRANLLVNATCRFPYVSRGWPVALPHVFSHPWPRWNRVILVQTLCQQGSGL
jgi:hypothetical protein